MDKLTRKLTEALNLMKLIQWDATMQIGDPVIVCWTSSGNFYRVKATVSKLNVQSVKCALTEPIAGEGSYYRDNPGTWAYSAGQDITVPRATLNGVTGRWSWNNCCLPQDQSVISESDVQELRHETNR